MATCDEREREDDCPGVWGYPICQWDKGGGKNANHHEHDEAEGESKPESTQDFGDFFEEIGLFDFLLRRTPRDVIREEVGEQGLGQVNRNATKEEKAVVDPDKKRDHHENTTVTHKNGTQVKFSLNASKTLRTPRRYSRRVKPTLPRTGKTKVHANQTSNECR